MATKGGFFMYTCDSCAIYTCSNRDYDHMPKNCPMRDEAFFEETLEVYKQPENQEFFVTCSSIEAIGYCEWPRLKETIELCKRMDYKRIGLAFCRGLHSEAKTIAQILRSHGLEVVSVACKTGATPKEAVGIKKEHKINPDKHESMCNPIAQAKLLNDQDTEFNIVVGLCVGHDSMFYKYSQALCTTLISKDRVLAHNPVGAVYCANGYMKKKLAPQA